MYVCLSWREDMSPLWFNMVRGEIPGSNIARDPALAGHGAVPQLCRRENNSGREKRGRVETVFLDIDQPQTLFMRTVCGAFCF